VPPLQKRVFSKDPFALKGLRLVGKEKQSVSREKANKKNWGRKQVCDYSRVIKELSMSSWGKKATRGKRRKHESSSTEPTQNWTLSLLAGEDFQSVAGMEKKQRRRGGGHQAQDGRGERTGNAKIDLNPVNVATIARGIIKRSTEGWRNGQSRGRRKKARSFSRNRKEPTRKRALEARNGGKNDQEKGAFREYGYRHFDTLMTSGCHAAHARKQ